MGSDADRLDGQFKAIVVKFSLSSSQYATMALRELMKSETSSAYQSTLNAESTMPEKVGE